MGKPPRNGGWKSRQDNSTLSENSGLGRGGHRAWAASFCASAPPPAFLRSRNPGDSFRRFPGCRESSVPRPPGSCCTVVSGAAWGWGGLRMGRSRSRSPRRGESRSSSEGLGLGRRPVPHFVPSPRAAERGDLFLGGEERGWMGNEDLGPTRFSPRIWRQFFSEVGVSPTLCHPHTVTFVVLVAGECRVRPRFPSFLGDRLQVIQPSCVRVPVIRHWG